MSQDIAVDDGTDVADLRVRAVTANRIEHFNRGYYSVPTAAMDLNTQMYTPLCNTLYAPFLGPTGVPTETTAFEMQSLKTVTCSFCGVRKTRHLKTSAIDQGHPTAYYCRQQCAEFGRIHGFALLDQFKEREARSLYTANNLSIPEVADMLNLSPQALRCVLRPEIDARVARERAKSEIYYHEGRQPRSSKKKQEDDIFAEDYVRRPVMIETLSATKVKRARKAKSQKVRNG